MSEVKVTALGRRGFAVTVNDRGVETRHKVSVPESFVEDLGLPDVDDETLVKESFEFLLEREPPTSILPEFALSTISDYFSDYVSELRRRLS